MSTAGEMAGETAAGREAVSATRGPNGAALAPSSASTTATTPAAAQPAQPAPGGGVALAAIHDFAAKLRQPSLLGRLQNYVRWQVRVREAEAEGRNWEDLLVELDDVPISINLDLTTSCNFACDHCVDMEILNTGIRYDHERLLSSLAHLAERGLKSVIVIGGGEPTTYPKFAEVMRAMKALGLRLGVVSNGTGMARIAEVADVLEPQDWVRLSLDSGSDETFQAMHKPRKPISLDEICAGVRPVKAVNPRPRIGFSYIITWRGCEANDASIVENLHEMTMATERARHAGFDYISFKPFLVRADENNAEIVDLAQQAQQQRVAEVMASIRHQLERCRKLETPGFRVIESTNLRVFLDGSFRDYVRQPQQCHMQSFRQVLSPLGLYNCPVYRHVPQARIGDKHAFATPEAAAATGVATAAITRSFEASRECREVTCLYNHVNWYIEELIANPARLDEIVPAEEREDWFL